VKKKDGELTELRKTTEAARKIPSKRDGFKTVMDEINEFIFPTPP
jgi:hypothetical protein